MDNTVTITKLTALNVLKLKTFVVDEFGKINILQGGNEVGKSSVMKVIRMAFAGCGKAPEIIHRNAEKGEIYIELSNGITIERTIRPYGSPVKVTENGAPKDNPQGWLDGFLGESFGLDPTSFFMKKGKERYEMFLRAVPFKLGREQFEAQIGGNIDLKDVDFTRHGITVLDDIKSIIYNTRKEANQSVTRLKKAIEQGKKEIPETFDPEPVRKFDLSAKSRQQKEFGDLINKHKNDLDAVIKYDKDILDKENLITKLEAQIGAIRGELLEIRHNKTETQDTIDKYMAPDVASLQSEIDNYSANQRLVYKLDDIDKQQKELTEASAKHKSLDNLYGQFENDIPIKLLSQMKMPLPNISLKDGKILLDGFDIDQLSDGAQIMCAFQLAMKLCPGELGTIMIDRWESLEPKNKQACLDMMAGTPYEWIIAERTEGPLTMIRDGVEVNPILQNGGSATTS